MEKKHLSYKDAFLLSRFFKGCSLDFAKPFETKLVFLWLRSTIGSLSKPGGSEQREREQRNPNIKFHVPYSLPPRFSFV